MKQQRKSTCPFGNIIFHVWWKLKCYYAEEKKHSALAFGKRGRGHFWRQTLLHWGIEVAITVLKNSQTWKFNKKQFHQIMSGFYLIVVYMFKSTDTYILLTFSSTSSYDCLDYLELKVLCSISFNSQCNFTNEKHFINKWNIN